MSAIADAVEGNFSSKTPLLRTADQYAVWKARIYTACWAACQIDIFLLKDNDCEQLLRKFNS